MIRLAITLAVTTFGLIGSPGPSFAQTKTHKWIDGMCESTIRYDSRKVDEKALKDTVALLSTEGGIPLTPLVDTPADIAKLRPAEFERECQAKAAVIRGYSLLPVDGLEALKAEQVRRIEGACTYGSIKMRGYTNPAVLRSFTPAAGKCDAFIDAMEGKTDLTAMWRKTYTEGCKDNASPARCRKRYEDQAAQPDGDAHKRLYLMTYGWGNCSNNYTSFNLDSEKFDKDVERMKKKLKQVYRVREVCERP